MPPEALSPADLLVFGALAVGLLLIPLGLPGLWVMVGAAVLHRVLGRSDELSLPFLALLVGLALVAEAVEALLGVVAARRFGASRWGMWGAFLGGIAGALALSPIFPLVGTLVGAFVGAFAGAFALELWKSKTFRSSWRAGLGAFVGRVAAVAVKVAIGVVIAVLIVWKVG
ncbi:MAG TPA: DUF456 domain-containing protein [Gemmatimonadota bacterium]